jgi:hypothetical protein
MKQSRRNTITLTTSLLALELGHVFASKVSADSLSIGVFPTVTEITARSGETLETKIDIKNFNNSSVTLTTLLQPFTVGVGSIGDIRYVDGNPDIFSRIQIFDARERVNEIVLGPKQEKSLTIRMSIPDEESPRDYYYSLVFLSKPLPQEVQTLPGLQAHSTVSAGVASHFLVAVNKSSGHTMSLSEFSTAPLNRNSPIPFQLRVANTGTNFNQIHGVIKVENILGMTVQDIPIAETTVLSQSTRSLSSNNLNGKSVPGIQMDETVPSTLRETRPLLPGIYRAKVKLQAEANSQSLSQTIYFAVAPYEILSVIIITIVILFILRKRLQKRNS